MPLEIIKYAVEKERRENLAKEFARPKLYATIDDTVIREPNYRNTPIKEPKQTEYTIDLV